ncbi:hypothetical protein TSOC_004680 [Tetrabaena socialis]|uniref:Uncharacterized protein n=1 Tax=Tetrabaena socialis TaxID=47790 RepID=A0A2J8A882_9CHLO|nr:hypothetical protein TSOC_004680 [Tetrabaena socialis]|eukprot:PNH08739.1 hypothetical protein TSOC_004680 [Tetrabaena socialis]
MALSLQTTARLLLGAAREAASPACRLGAHLSPRRWSSRAPDAAPLAPPGTPGAPSGGHEQEGEPEESKEALEERKRRAVQSHLHSGITINSWRRLRSTRFCRAAGIFSSAGRGSAASPRGRVSAHTTECRADQLGQVGYSCRRCPTERPGPAAAAATATPPCREAPEAAHCTHGPRGPRTSFEAAHCPREAPEAALLRPGSVTDLWWPWIHRAFTWHSPCMVERPM